MNFYPDSNIKNFHSIISDELFGMCEFLDEGVTEEAFYQNLPQLYSKMLKYVDSTTYNNYEVLQETMIFFTVVTGIAYTFLNPILFNLIWK